MNEESTQKSLTIIVAVLNAEKTIRRCLQSIADQTYSDFELIVIDGDSTDNSIEIIQDYAKIIAYFDSRKDGGIYVAWNKGLARSQGKWVMFVGADDYFPDSSVLENLMSFAGNQEVDFITVRNIIVDPQGKPLKTIGKPWMWSQFKQKMSVCHVGALHRREYFSNYGSFDAGYKIAGDYELLMRAGAALRTTDFGSVVAHCGADGVSRTRIAQAYREAVKLQRTHRSSSFVSSLVRYALSYGYFYVKKPKELIAQYRAAK